MQHFKSFSENYFQQTVLNCYLDFEKAFDKVSNRNNLRKLQNMSIGRKFLAILENYLKDRKQYVKIGQKNQLCLT